MNYMYLTQFCAAVSERLGEKWSYELHPVRVIPFTERPGPIPQLTEDATPRDFFHLLWEPSFFQLLADQTNLYARQKQATTPDRRWHPTSPEEMMAFVGVNIIMGIDKKPEICNYWSTDEFLGNEGVKKVFPRERFEALTRYLHLNDSAKMPGRDQPGYDPLYKVQPLIQLCKHTFLEHYTPAREMSVDEAMIRYKGRVFFRQYMPKKPTKWGIKVWTLADSRNGYVSNFDIYLGKAPPDQQAEHTLSTRVVLNLSKPFYHSNRHMFFDNYFNSQVLCEELLKLDLYACGTLNANRYPPPLKTGRTAIKLRKGETKQLQKGNLLVTIWHDKRQVAVLSTNCQPNQTVTVQRRAKQPPHVRRVSIPAPIKQYNTFMGGVDLNDQFRSYYTSGRTGKKWWRYVFWYLLDVSICNAMVLEHVSPTTRHGRKRRALFPFKLQLAKELIGGFCGRKRYPGLKRKCASTQSTIAISNLPGHSEVKFSGRKRVCMQCARCGRKTPSGRTPETSFGCDRCGVNLCRNGCFLQYHAQHSYST